MARMGARASDLSLVPRPMGGGASRRRSRIYLWGFQKTRPEVDKLLEYCHRQGLTTRKFNPEEMFIRARCLLSDSPFGAPFRKRGHERI